MKAVRDGVAAVCVWLALAGMISWAAPDAESAEPLDAAVVEYVAAQALGLTPEAERWRKRSLIPPEKVEARLTFDREQYDLGDPIFATSTTATSEDTFPNSAETYYRVRALE